MNRSFDYEIEARWLNVKARLSAVLQNMQNSPVKTVPQDWIDIYTDVAELNKRNDPLGLRRMYVHVRQYIRELVGVHLSHLQSVKGVDLLIDYLRRWREIASYVEFMKRVLNHLQRYWIADNVNSLKNDPVRPLDKLLMFYWREDLLGRLPAVVDISLNLIDDERRGKVVDRDAVRGIVNNFVEIGAADVCDNQMNQDTIDGLEPRSFDHFSTLRLYLRVFEEPFISRTREFFKREGVRIARDGKISSFVSQIQDLLNREEERVRCLLHEDSIPRVRRAAEEELVGNHKEYLQEEAAKMIHEGREQELIVVYKLLDRVYGLIPIRDFFSNYVRNEGNLVISKYIQDLNGSTDIARNLVILENLVYLYMKHSSMVRRCFDGSNMMLLAIDNAFRCFLNRSLGPISLAQLLAHYVDHFLTSENQKDIEVSEVYDDACDRPEEKCERENPPQLLFHEIQGLELNVATKDVKSSGRRKARLHDALMDEIVRLFGYLDEKECFFEAHRILFGKRLLQKSHNDLESDFVHKLKLKAGHMYTQRLTGMLQDIPLCYSFREKLSKHIQAQRQYYFHTKREDHNILNSEKALSFKTPSPAGMPTFLTNRNNALGGVIPPHPSLSNEEPHAARVTGKYLSALPTLPQPTSATRGKDVSEQLSTALSITRMSKHVENAIFLQGTQITDALSIDFNGHIVNAMNWPKVKNVDLNVPPIIQTCQKIIAEFYLRTKQHQKLTWVHAASKTHLKANIGSQGYEFVLSTFQASFLLLLNDKDRIPLKEASKALNVPTEELLEYIKPLIYSRKHKVLLLQMGNGLPTPSIKHAPSSTPIEANRYSAKPRKELMNNSAEKETSCSMYPSNHPGGSRKRRAPDFRIEQPSPMKRSRLMPPERNEISQISSYKSEGAKPIMKISSALQMVTPDPSEGKTSPRPKPLLLLLGPETTEQDNEGQIMDSYICINTKFISNHRVIAFPAEMSRIPSSDAPIVKKEVVIDRNTQIDSVLVRVMKSRKRATHRQLCAELILALSKQRFMPDPELIKKRLERLIDQEYITRDKRDPKLYIYCA